MSSYICSPKHFNSIEFSLKTICYGNEFYFPYSFKNVFPVLYDRRHYSADTIDETVVSIIDILRELNVLCVSLQYKHHYEGRLDAEISEQRQLITSCKGERKQLTKIELYKALCCVDYQIETEHLKELRELMPEENNALFFVKEMKNTLAADIVNSLPDYDNAGWEIN